MNTQYSITVRYDRGDASKCKKPEDDAPPFQKTNIKIKFYNNKNNKQQKAHSV